MWEPREGGEHSAIGTKNVEQSLGKLLLSLWGNRVLSKTVYHQGSMFPTKHRSTGPVGGQRSSRYRDRDNNSDDFIYRVIKTHNICKPQRLPRKNESPEGTGRRGRVRGWVGWGRQHGRREKQVFDNTLVQILM